VITKSGELYDRQGFLTHRGVEVARHTETSANGKVSEYIRVGSALYWQEDMVEHEDHFECLASGAKIKIK
jgi:hypothetical protein